jgi:TRAP-type C4-dicarboxylate transport system substrate-binding protein
MKIIAAAAAAALTLCYTAAVHAADPILIKYAFPAPPFSYVNVGGVTPWAKDVEAAAGDGVLEIKVYPGGSIANFSNAYDRVVNAVAEAAFGTTGSISGALPRSNVTNLPGLSEDAVESSLALWRMQAKGALGDDWAKVHVLTLFTVPGTGLHSAKPMRTVEELKGEKIGSGGRIGSQALSLLGAAPVSMTPAETYQSLQRGLVAGATMSWAGVAVFKLNEVTHHHLDAPFGLASAYMIMNKEFYARLPDKAKAAIDKYSGEAYARRVSEYGRLDDEKQLAKLKVEANQHFYKLSKAEEARWLKVMAPITEEWVRDTPDGAKTLAAFKQELAAIRSGK